MACNCLDSDASMGKSGLRHGAPNTMQKTHEMLRKIYRVLVLSGLSLLNQAKFAAKEDNSPCVPIHRRNTSRTHPLRNAESEWLWINCSQCAYLSKLPI